MVSRTELEPLLKLVRRLERRGRLLHFDLAVAETFEDVPDAECCIQQAVAEGLLEHRIFSYPDEAHVVYSLKHSHLTPHVLEAAIRVFERHHLIPFLSRIQDVLVNVFGLKVTNAEVLQTYKQTWEAHKLTDHGPSGEIEAILPLTQLNLPHPPEITRRLDKRVQRILEDPEYQPPNSTVLKTFYLYWTSMFRHSFCEIFLAVEAIAQQTTVSECSYKEVLDLCELLQQENPGWSADQLETAVNMMLSPNRIDYQAFGVHSFEELLHRLQSTEQNADCEECPICLEELLERVFELECKHQFHTACIKNYLEGLQAAHDEQRCACCRSPVSDKDLRMIQANHHTHYIKLIEKQHEEPKQVANTEFQCYACGFGNSSQEDFAACEICETMHCTRCKRLVGSCSCLI